MVARFVSLPQCMPSRRVAYLLGVYAAACFIAFIVGCAAPISAPSLTRAGDLATEGSCSTACTEETACAAAHAALVQHRESGSPSILVGVSRFVGGLFERHVPDGLRSVVEAQRRLADAPREGFGPHDLRLAGSFSSLRSATIEGLRWPPAPWLGFSPVGARTVYKWIYDESRAPYLLVAAADDGPGFAFVRAPLPAAARIQVIHPDGRLLTTSYPVALDAFPPATQARFSAAFGRPVTNLESLSAAAQSALDADRRSVPPVIKDLITVAVPLGTLTAGTGLFAWLGAQAMSLVAWGASVVVAHAQWLFTLAVKAGLLLLTWLGMAPANAPAIATSPAAGAIAQLRVKPCLETAPTTFTPALDALALIRHLASEATAAQRSDAIYRAALNDATYILLTEELGTWGQSPEQASTVLEEAAARVADTILSARLPFELGERLIRGTIATEAEKIATQVFLIAPSPPEGATKAVSGTCGVSIPQSWGDPSQSQKLRELSPMRLEALLGMPLGHQWGYGKSCEEAREDLAKKCAGFLADLLNTIPDQLLGKATMQTQLFSVTPGECGDVQEDGSVVFTRQVEVKADGNSESTRTNVPTTPRPSQAP